MMLARRNEGSRWLVLCGLVLCGLALWACRPSERAERTAPAAEPPPARAFYYWRTVFALSAPERTALRELQISRLYVRLFDVAWSSAAAAPELVGELTVAQGEVVPAGVELVPVVFVRQEVLQHLDRPGVAALARVLWRGVQTRAALLGARPGELQLDCDWTDRSRDRFFALLQELRALDAADRTAGAAAPPLRLSATIRLHQIKYRERTGVPPVERGMLMFYNMGRFSSLAQDRAIFDAGSAEKYLARLRDYPLPLDVALPIWSWTLHLRDGEVIDLLQSTDAQELAGVAFLRPTGRDRYVATETAFFRGALLRAGDELKGERLSATELAAAAAQVAPRLAPSPADAPRTLALFDLSERNLRRHDSSQLEHLFLSAFSVR